MKKISPQQIIEAILFSANQPVAIETLVKLTALKSKKKVNAEIENLNQFYEKTLRAFRIYEIAGGFQLRTKKELNAWIHQSKVQKSFHLSTSALETLSIIAYKQPVTRADIEYVRSVDCSYIIRALLQMNLIKITGKSDKAGRPLLYGTSDAFLELFGFKSIQDLPLPEDMDFEINE